MKHHGPHRSDTRNLVIALVLASVVMIGWQVLYEMPRMDAAREEKFATEQKMADAKAEREAKSGATGTAPKMVTTAMGDTITIDTSPRVKIESSTVHGSISLKGGQFDDITLANYHEGSMMDYLAGGNANNAPAIADGKHDFNDAPEVKLLRRGSEPYSANFGVISSDANLKLPGKNTIWKSKNTTLTPDSPLVLTYDNGAGLVFEKTIMIDQHYMFSVTIAVKNNSGKAVELYPYGLINRTAGEDGKMLDMMHEGPIGVMGGELKHIKYSELAEDGDVNVEGTKGWIGITDKYWLTALIPNQNDSVDVSFRHVTREGKAAVQIDMRGAGVRVEAGESHDFSTRFFAGAKEVKLLDQYRDLLNIPLFDRAVDFGMLYFLTKPIFLVLSFFNSIVGNFGLAILLLTVCIRLLMYPLANKSYKAMSQMKLLTPKMKEIREKYADDKMKINLEIMEMYKREKVNPMSGCLPILLQLPVFFALYKVLFVTIEMRHAPFFGWIHDLSAPDPTSIVNLFGLLPFDVSGLPSWLNIGVWPLIMCATMVLQQRLNPKPTDEIQATMIAWMPFIFLFMFAHFPAGLVIYWAWNNTLSIAQQWHIQRRLQKTNPTLAAARARK